MTRFSRERTEVRSETFFHSSTGPIELASIPTYLQPYDRTYETALNMRLLQRPPSGELKFTKFEKNIPEYAILSHTWSEDSIDEVTYDSFRGSESEYLQQWPEDKRPSKSFGYRKLQFCAEQAARDGLKHFWVDTCCIDKCNPTELQESIRSMFTWYRNAARCYVYLTDIATSDSTTDSGSTDHSWVPEFRKSRWFTRGWTLQELLAPASVEFFSVEGDRLGDRVSLEKGLTEITGIPSEALQARDLARYRVTERLKWSSERTTARKDHQAYALPDGLHAYTDHIYGSDDDRFDRLRAASYRRIEELQSVSWLKIEPVSSVGERETIPSAEMRRLQWSKYASDVLIGFGQAVAAIPIVLYHPGEASNLTGFLEARYHTLQGIIRYVSLLRGIGSGDRPADSTLSPYPPVWQVVWSTPTLLRSSCRV